MEQLKKLEQTLAQLKAAVDKVSSAKTSSEANAADSEIGACLRSMQYGIGVVGIECKHFVENRQKELRGIKIEPPKVEPVTEEVVKKVTKKRRTKKASK